MSKRAKGEGTIKKRKDGRWVALLSFGYLPDGKRDRRAVYGKTQAEAKDKLEKLKAQRDRLNSPNRLTIEDLYPEWLKTKRSVSERTREMYGHHAKTLLKVIGNKKVSELSIRDVEKMISVITETKSAHAASKCRLLLSMIMDTAVAWDYALKNPVSFTEAPKLKPLEPAVWSFSEIAFFLEVAKAHSLYPAFYLMVATGLRRGELLGLRWSEVKPEAISIIHTLVMTHKKLVSSSPKTKAGKRVIPVASDIYQLLEAHRQNQILANHYSESGLVFTSEVGTPIAPRNLARAFDLIQSRTRVAYLIGVYTSSDEETALEALERVNTGKIFKRLRLHDLRHTHVSLSVNSSDISLSELAKRVGHSKLSYTLDIYTHVLPNRDAPKASLEALKLSN
jgi:integrase